MSEDVSSQIRVGVTVILVAALVAAVLNLMVVAQSILSSGLSTLQGGADQIASQEWEKYNQSKPRGYEVKSALALYEGSDIAIIVRTTYCVVGSPWGYNYGSLLDSAVVDTGNDSGLVYKLNSALTKSTGNSYYTANLRVESGSIPSSNNTKGITSTGDTEFVLESASFRSELIKDSTGTVVGIVFTQLAN